MGIIGKELFQFQTPCPKYKEQVISLNNISKWHRFHSSKIKNEFKDLLKEWYIPTPEKQYESIYVEFMLYRHNKRTLDSDNLGFQIKWIIDAIKETENEDILDNKSKPITWIIDDDKVKYSVEPAILDRDLLETELKVVVYEYGVEKG